MYRHILQGIHTASTYDTLDQIVYGFIAAATAPSVCFTAICLLGISFNFLILRADITAS